MYEYPPILRGEPTQQLAQLRDYLVRLAQRQEQTESAAQTQPAASASAAARSAAGAQERAGALRDLTVKTARQQQRDEKTLREVRDRALAAESLAETAESSLGELRLSLRSEYVAQSDFGSYAQQITARLEAEARAVTESYRYAELVSAAAAAGVRESLEQYMTLIDGQIRRGYLTDPSTGETVIGIAVSQKLRFTGRTQTVDGEVCYELDGAQTFGLYTSTGWQFWVGGQKIGWFDSADGMLHVARMVAEQELKLGEGWLMTSAGGFGVRYIGG